MVRALCAEVGPLAVTSANLHGAPPATSADQVVAGFRDADGLALVMDGGTCDGVPSTVVECRGPASRCLREGALPGSDLGRTGSRAVRRRPVAGRPTGAGVDGARPDRGHWRVHVIEPPRRT